MMNIIVLILFYFFTAINFSSAMDKSLDPIEATMSTAFIIVNLGVIGADLETTYVAHKHNIQTILTKEYPIINPFSYAALSCLAVSINQEISPSNRRLMREKGVELTACAVICMRARNQSTANAIDQKYKS